MPNETKSTITLTRLEKKKQGHASPNARLIHIHPQEKRLKHDGRKRKKKKEKNVVYSTNTSTQSHVISFHLSSKSQKRKLTATNTTSLHGLHKRRSSERTVHLGDGPSTLAVIIGTPTVRTDDLVHIVVLAHTLAASTQRSIHPRVCRGGVGCDRVRL